MSIRVDLPLCGVSRMRMPSAAHTLVERYYQLFIPASGDFLQYGLCPRPVQAQLRHEATSPAESKHRR
jgi:hypothetical protein